MNQTVPFITFQPSRGQRAADAMEFYCSVFPDGRVVDDRRYGPEGPGEEGTVILAEFEIAGLRMRCSDSFIQHEWNITPAISLMIDCESADEQQRLFASLSEGGAVYMPLDDYGFGPFGWVGDRFGVTWQLGLKT
ncbi:VOC family protein [Gordonia amarae]|nr:VOC family protein [Gordonia amarae]MCS3879675.1 putative 3-demethylubiquinone-9 3-methyltransferase (glyoxalase superfamily) [Gordonia amarae]QHN18117.1 VOC family protein [Gordonia amarae]QHN22638.1 VOC family protein [Gordonia amarae]QHN31504.1 VOC family protein [Gordonia amarae]QHN40248.1 VOC family protein [Gordonia amarae]